MDLPDRSPAHAAFANLEDVSDRLASLQHQLKELAGDKVGRWRV